MSDPKKVTITISGLPHTYKTAMGTCIEDLLKGRGIQVNRILEDGEWAVTPKLSRDLLCTAGQNGISVDIRERNLSKPITINQKYDALFLDGNNSPEDPHVFIQWKGTNVCLDFHCSCGAHCHFDGYFAYVLKCPHCEQEWEMPQYMIPRKRSEKTYVGAISQIMEPDEDMTEEE